MLELKYLSKLGDNLSNRKKAFVKMLKLLVTAIAPELLEMLNPFANKANKEHFLYIALFPFSVNQKMKKNIFLPSTQRNASRVSFFVYNASQNLSCIQPNVYGIIWLILVQVANPWLTRDDPLI